MLQRRARVRWLVGLALVMFSAFGPWPGPQTVAARAQRYPFPDPGPAAQIPTGDSKVYLPIVMANGPSMGQASCVAWSPDGRTLASSSRDQTIRLWDVEQGSYRAALHGHTAGTCGLAFTPDEKMLYVNDTERGHIRAFDVAADGALSNSRVFAQTPGADGMRTR